MRYLIHDAGIGTRILSPAGLARGGVLQHLLHIPPQACPEHGGPGVAETGVRTKACFLGLFWVRSVPKSDVEWLRAATPGRAPRRAGEGGRRLVELAPHHSQEVALLARPSPSAPAPSTFLTKKSAPSRYQNREDILNVLNFGHHPLSDGDLQPLNLLRISHDVQLPQTMLCGIRLSHLLHLLGEVRELGRGRDLGRGISKPGLGPSLLGRRPLTAPALASPFPRPP